MKELGVDRVFVDKCSGKNTDRPQFHEMMSLLESGDTVVVESYSRMSRSTKDLLETVEKLNALGVGFVSKKENIDTTTAAGRMFLTFIAGMNQFEREVMLERQAEGIAAMPVDENGKRISAKTGRGFGRASVEVDVSLLPGENIVAACKRLGISRATFYRKSKNSCRA
jgi:DNA invertase Pin-like site-specific DNA recombinase